MGKSLSYLFCGDDFTGASDTLATLARAGLKSRLFLSASGLEKCRDLSDLDAAGLATANRAMAPEVIAEQMAGMGRLILEFGPRVFHYKVCSTFDSSAEIGSIGAAVNALEKVIPRANTMILGGQPSLGRYCAFSHLFAAGPPKGEVFRLDTHPTMACHPVTPMADADIRQVLANQGLEGVQGIHWPEYAKGFDHVLETVRAVHADGGIPLFDALVQAEIDLLGSIMTARDGQPVMWVGASSVAQAYTSALSKSRSRVAPRQQHIPDKPVFVLAGSRSQATAAQVEHARGFTRVEISPGDIEQDRDGVLDLTVVACLEVLGRGCHVLAVVSGEMDHSLGRDEIAGFTASLTAKIALSGSIGRLGIAGGDTSSLALQRLGVESLSYLADIEPGICLCRLHAPDIPGLDCMEVALKGGQMGSPDFFEKLTGSL